MDHQATVSSVQDLVLNLPVDAILITVADEAAMTFYGEEHFLLPWRPQLGPHRVLPPDPRRTALRPSYQAGRESAEALPFISAARRHACHSTWPS